MPRPTLARLALSLCVALLVTAQTAWAQTTSGQGTVTYIQHSSEEVNLAGGTTLMRAHLKGVVLADDPSVPFHMSPQDCIGANILGRDGLPLAGYGHCEGVDQAGHAWFIWYHNSPDGNTWGFMGGTGKYEGIEGGGTTQDNPPSPDGRLVISWEGTWTMKM